MDLLEKQTTLHKPRNGLPVYAPLKIDKYKLRDIIDKNIKNKKVISSDTVTTVDDVKERLEALLKESQYNKSDHVFDNLYELLSKLDLDDYAKWIYDNEFYYYLPLLNDNILFHFDLINIYVLSSFFKKMFN